MPETRGLIPDETTRLLGRASAYEAGSGVGWGDVNGDGYADLWVGEGNLTLVTEGLGVDEGPISLSGYTTRVYGASAGDQVGIKIAGDQDVNGDGALDVLIGALKAHSAVGEVGAADLVAVLRSGLRARAFGEDDNGIAVGHGLGGSHAGAVFGVVP